MVKYVKVLRTYEETFFGSLRLQLWYHHFRFVDPSLCNCVLDLRFVLREPILCQFYRSKIQLIHHFSSS